MSAFRPVLVKVRVYEEQQGLWERFLRGEPVTIRPTGYRDGVEAEAVIIEAEGAA
jgi:hypothetical protein